VTVTRTQELLLAAVERAAEKNGVPGAFGLSELEVSYGGPASGAAGAVVRKWPDGGIQHKGLKLDWGKDGRRTVVRVGKRVFPLPERNVEWTELRDRAARVGGLADLEIEDRADPPVFIAYRGGLPDAVVCWSGQDARAAQGWLKARSFRRCGVDGCGIRMPCSTHGGGNDVR